MFGWQREEFGVGWRERREQAGCGVFAEDPVVGFDDVEEWEGGVLQHFAGGVGEGEDVLLELRAELGNREYPV